jgi:transcriptional regulator NrdR family protein
MILCEKCDGKSMVFDTRTIGPTVRRRRKCLSCGWRWSTAEVPLATFKEIKRAEKPAHQLQGVVHG